MSTSRTVRIVLEALGALGGHRLRNGLAVLGMVIGVAAVVLMVAIGRGVQNRVLADIERMGTDLLTVNAGSTRFRGARRRTASRVNTLKQDDARALERTLPAVLRAVPLELRRVNVKVGEALAGTTLTGTTPAFFAIQDYEIDQGVFFSDDDLKRLKRVAVLGPAVSWNLFGDDSALGRRIVIQKVPFVVIGMYQSKGLDAFGEDQDDQILIPVTTMIRRVLHQEHLSTLILQVAPGNLDANLIKEVRTLLRERHNLRKPNQPDDFTLSTQKELLESKSKSARTFALLISSVASISMVVAGVGILAVMLISIQERTSEIGLRRALGATRLDLLHQFLLEALVLGSVGGAAGAFLGLVAALILRVATPLQFALPWTIALMAALMAILISLIFGVLPARRAANLDPVDALTTE